MILAPVVSDALNPSYTRLLYLWVGTQVEYDALVTKEPNTLYVVQS